MTSLRFPAMSKIVKQPAPPISDRDKGLPENLQRSLKRSEERFRALRQKLKEAESGGSPSDPS